MRVQLSLYVPRPMVDVIETIRRIVDPVQSRLVPPHVTLCRDEDLDGVSLAEMRARLGAASTSSITLTFGPAETFHGHGLLLPCIDGHAEFHRLRALALGGDVHRDHTPHLTLAHPRNPRAPGNDVAATRALPTPLEIRFASVHWIEQEPDEPWRVRHTYALDEAD